MAAILYRVLDGAHANEVVVSSSRPRCLPFGTEENNQVTRDNGLADIWPTYAPTGKGRIALCTKRRVERRVVPPVVERASPRIECEEPKQLWICYGRSLRSDDVTCGWKEVTVNADVGAVHGLRCRPTSNSAAGATPP